MGEKRSVQTRPEEETPHSCAAMKRSEMEACLAEISRVWRSILGPLSSLSSFVAIEFPNAWNRAGTDV